MYAASATDLSKHIDLYGGNTGICVQANTLTFNSPIYHSFIVNGATVGYVDPSGLNMPIGVDAAYPGTFTTLNVTPGGLAFSTAVGSAYNDFSKHINLSNPNCGINVTAAGNNYVTFAGAAHIFYVGSSRIAYTNPGGLTVDTGLALTIGGGTGPTWTTGSAAPASAQPVGSLYSRVGGAVGATLYVSRGGGTWAAVAGV